CSPDLDGFWFSPRFRTLAGLSLADRMGIMTARDAKRAVESTWRKVPRAHRAGLPPGRQAFEIQLRHAAAHEVGDDAGRAAGHGPTHVPVTAVEEEIAMAAETEDGWPIGGHGPEARAVFSPIVVGGVGADVM